MLRKLTRRREELADVPREDFKLRLLREADLFRGLADADMRDIERTTRITTSKRGRLFYTPGDPPETLFILKKGRVELFRIAEDGRRLVTAVFGPGSVFGEMEMLSQRMHGNSAQALEDCTVCVMSRPDLERLIESKPRLALNVVQIVAERLAEAERLLEILAYGRVRQRLAALLLEISAGGSEVSGLSQQHLAERIGASRETVTRALAELRGEGLVEVGRGQIAIRSRDRLRAVAAG